MKIQTKNRQDSQAGFTLIELIIGAVLVLVLAFLVASLAIRGADAQKYAERVARAMEISQGLTDEIEQDLQSSVRLLTDDATGNALLALCELSHLPTPLPGWLPTLDAGGVFTPDVVGSAKTGNRLAFVRHGWTDQFATTTGNEYRVDIYRLVYFYLSLDGSGPQQGSPDGLNLVRWVSEPLADAAQVDAISDPVDQAEVLLHLLNQTPDVDGQVHDAVDVVYEVGGDLTLAPTLRQISSVGSLSNSPISGRPSPWNLLGDNRLSSTGLLYYRHHSIATNFAPAVMGVGRFGITELTGAGFPHGFEVQVVGPSAARQILVHLSLVTTNRRGHRAYHDSQVIADTRDL